MKKLRLLVVVVMLAMMSGCTPVGPHFAVLMVQGMILYCEEKGGVSSLKEIVGPRIEVFGVLWSWNSLIVTCGNAEARYISYPFAELIKKYQK